MNYIDLIIGALIVELIMMSTFLSGIFKSKYLFKWYEKFGLGAVLADITSVSYTHLTLPTSDLV